MWNSPFSKASKGSPPPPVGAKLPVVQNDCADTKPTEDTT